MTSKKVVLLLIFQSVQNFHQNIEYSVAGDLKSPGMSKSWSKVYMGGKYRQIGICYILAGGDKF